MKTLRKFLADKLAGIRSKLAGIAAEPQKVSMGFALGIFLSASPFIGIKVLIALALTFIFKLNKLAAIIGVLHVNILTAPVFYGFSFMVGKSVLGSDASFDFSWPITIDTFYEILFTNSGVFPSLLAGGLILGVPMSIIAYFFSKYAIHCNTSDKSNDKQPNEAKPVFTLITGASTGLGKEIAIECARHHKNLILVALPGRNLKQLCAELEYSYEITAISLECDLTNEVALNELAAYVTQNFSVDQLVNNAGIGGTLRFADATCEYLDKIIQLNIRATTMLTLLMLPELMLHKKALILNIASIAAFGPIPYKTIYPASKAFIYSFSRSLSKELQGTGVKVVVVNPGQILTNPAVTMRIMRQGILGKMGLLTAGKIARISLSAVEKGKVVVVPGFINKVNRILIKWLPEFLRLTLLEKAYRKELTISNILN